MSVLCKAAQTTLGEVISFKSGKSIKPGSLGRYPVFGSNGIIGSSDKTIHKNGVIIGRVGAYCGSVAYCPTAFWASDNTLVAYPISDEIDVRFLYYLLGNANLRNYAGGAAQPLVTQTVLKQVEINIPDLPTQKKIAGILSAYDDLIENNLRRIKILEEMAQSLYREWFVHFRFPGHESVKFVDSTMGQIPKGWEVTSIGEICSFIGSGGTPKRSEDAFWKGGTIDWYKTKELWDSHLFNSEEKITTEGLKRSSARLVEAGTILMAIYGSPTVGRLGLVTRSSACNQAALALKPDLSRISQEYLFYALIELRAHFNSIAQGAAQQNISKQKVVDARLLLPTNELIGKFTQKAELFWELLLNLRTRNQNLRKSRDLLLPKLLSTD